MAVVAGEYQGLGNLGAAGEDIGEEPVAELADHGADLVRGDDVAIEVLGRVGKIGIEELGAAGAREAVALVDPKAGFDARARIGDAGIDSVDVKIDVYAIGYGVRIRVGRHDVLVEEAEGVLGWRSGETDEECVEIFQDLTPEVVDGTVALVGDYEVEGFDGDGPVVFDGVRDFVEVRQGGGGGFFVAGVVVRIAFQDGIKPLDGGDGDTADRVDGIRGEQLDVVDLGELAPIAGNAELLELIEGLAAESAAVHQEENAPGASEGDQAVDEVAGGEGLSAAHGHVDEGAGVVAGEGLFEVRNDAVLMIPKALARDGRHDAQPVAQATARRLEIGFEPTGERFGAVETEDGTAARVGFQEVGEARLDASGLITERERAARRGEIPGKPDAVFGGLDFDADQGDAGLLRFHDADCVSIDVQEVIGEAVPWSELEFSNGYAAAGFNVDVVAILDQPTGTR